ncbi:MAG: molybdenum cofactor biosynthesis protein MoaE [Gemmataceae bacterium]|nr:molybdenum cofactor biosynthesis protein MoaE [Gemmataceae bacterium]
MVGLTHDPIDVARLLNEVRRPGCGGVVLFLGTVRDLTGTDRTIALEYESHAGMAQRELTAIADEAKSRWPMGGLAVIHRLGLIPVGEIAVGVVGSCPHRAEAFAAVQFVVDELKRRAAIWKKDHTPDGPGTWVENPQAVGVPTV